MQRTVYKYPFHVEDWFELDLPAGAKILKVECKSGMPCMWALVDPDPHAATERRKFRIYGTGHPIMRAETLAFVATFQQPPYVWHLFEVKEPE